LPGHEGPDATGQALSCSSTAAAIKPQALPRRGNDNRGCVADLREWARKGIGMQIGMIGLGRMGGNMARRLLGDRHDCVVHDIDPEPVRALVEAGATAADSIGALASQLGSPRLVWLMLPAPIVDETIGALVSFLEPGDTVVDGGNSHFHDDVRRAEELRSLGIHYVDVGTSGGVWGLENGYCQMIGGEPAIVKRLEPVFASLAPPVDAVARTPGRQQRGTGAERGFLHCGPSGAGHFAKMVHNGIEYGVMAAYAEGFDMLRHAGVGRQAQAADAQTAPPGFPDAFRYEFDLAEIAELWRRGSVIRSWLLDLTAQALLRDPELAGVSGRVSDSGEGRWALKAAVDEGVPAPVLAAALFQRFGSRASGDFANRILSAMRREFGGHREADAPDGRA